MLYGASSFKQNLNSWLSQINDPSVESNFWCGGGAVCDAKSVCYGMNKAACKKVKKVCVFGKRKIFGACKPKNSNYQHNCADYDNKEACGDDQNHEGLCKFNNNSCSHVCDDLEGKDCKKFRNTTDNEKTCKPTKVKNPCNGCQLKTICE